MKICIDCGRQLFDRDNSCDKCNSKNIISEKEYNKIVEELKRTNIFTKKKLLQNRDHKCIYERLQQPEASYPKPIILGNNNYENDEEYWKRITNIQLIITLQQVKLLSVRIAILMIQRK